MEVISPKVIAEVGRQIEPCTQNLSREERSTFERILKDFSTKELKAHKMKTIRAELKCVARLAGCIDDDVSQAQLLERYEKLSKQIEEL